MARETNLVIHNICEKFYYLLKNNCSYNDTLSINNFKYKFNNYNGHVLEECTHLIGLVEDTFDDKTNNHKLELDRQRMLEKERLKTDSKGTASVLRDAGKGENTKSATKEMNNNVNFCINSICRGSKSIIRDCYCSKDNIDILFYNIPYNLPLDTNSVNVLFGCDETKLIPKKNNDILEVLIDHSYYSQGNENSDIEYSSKILNKTAEFFKSYKKQFILRRFISNGIEEIDINKPIKSDLYNRIGLPYDEACEIYNKSHVFVVTHKESLGYSVIECAMAGALIVSFGNFINKNYLNNFHNIIFDNIEDFNWDTIIENIDVQKSRKMAEKFTWDIFFDKIILNLNLFTDKKCNNNKVLKKIFNTFERSISIYTDNNDILNNLVELGYNNVYTYNRERL